MTTADSSTSPSDKTITEHELEQCQRANQTGRTPVVFVHGLWLLPNSWDRWAKLFEDNSYVALTPGGRTTRDGRGGRRAPRGVHRQVDRPGRRPLRDHHVPTPGKPLFQAATANLNPWTEAKVDTHTPDRGRC